MGTIVVGIDGSGSSTKALDWAVGEARLRHDDLRLVHGWHAPATVAMADASMAVVSWEVIEDAARELLHDAAEHARGLGSTVTEVLVERHAASAVIEQAVGADLVVVGRREHGGLAGLVLGSVSQEIAHHASCPVVIIPLNSP